MNELSSIGKIARAARLKDIREIDRVLDGMHGYEREVQEGRSSADRAARRDPPLPPLDFDPLEELRKQGIGWQYRPEESAGIPARKTRKRRAA